MGAEELRKELKELKVTDDNAVAQALRLSIRPNLTPVSQVLDTCFTLPLKHKLAQEAEKADVTLGFVMWDSHIGA